MILVSCVNEKDSVSRPMGKEAQRNWAMRVPYGHLAETVIFGHLVLL